MVPEELVGLAAVPVGGGGVWPGFETMRRATSATTAPLVWRVPEEFVRLAVVLVGGGGAWMGYAQKGQTTLVWMVPEELVGLAAVPVGGGGAWPGFEATRRAEGSWRGRRAGGPPPTGAHSSPEHPWGADGERAGRRPRARTAARNTRGARTASGRAAAHGHAQQPGTPVGHARNSRGPEAPQRLGPHTHVRQLLTG